MVKPKVYNFTSVKGMSENQLSVHYKLYLNYVDKVNEINSLSVDSDNYKNSNTTYSPLRSIKLGETYSLNGVILHELYFENITTPPQRSTIDKCLLDEVNKTFGNFQNFIEYFKEVGLSMRGWAILSYDMVTGNLKVIGCDAHDVGAIWWKAYPLLVLDVYEHAYFIDFNSDRRKYMDIFFQNVNWGIVNMRFKQCRFMCNR